MEPHDAHNYTSTLTELAIVLAAAFLGGALIQGLRQPVLVGYIIVGVLLGPSVFGLLHDEGQITLLAELGILLLLFVVGMELDLKRFAPVYKIAVLTAAAQIMFSLGAMTLLGTLFDWPIGRILLLGFAFSLSSTAVAIKLLQDMSELDKPLGRATVGVLIAQDIAAIPMMLIIAAVGGSGTITVWEIAKIVIALGLMGVLFYLLTHKTEFFTRYAKRIPTQSQRTIVALAFCFSAAAASGMAGLSAAYGAFLAGLIIGNSTDHDFFVKQIEPIFDLLIMVFFLSIGLLIDLKFLWENLWNVLGLLLVIMGIKTVLNYKILRFLKLSRRHAIMMGASLGQVGEFSFVIAALGLSAGAIMAPGYKYVISIIALSLMITPIWLYVVRRMNLIRYRTRKLRTINGPTG